jgi:hypothetical protein
MKNLIRNILAPSCCLILLIFPQLQTQTSPAHDKTRAHQNVQLQVKILESAATYSLVACAGQPCLTNIHRIQTILREFQEHHAKTEAPPSEEFDTQILKRMTEEASAALLAIQSLSPNSDFTKFMEEMGGCAKAGKAPCPAKALGAPKADIITGPCNTRCMLSRSMQIDRTDPKLHLRCLCGSPSTLRRDLPTDLGTAISAMLGKLPNTV